MINQIKEQYTWVTKLMVIKKLLENCVENKTLIRDYEIVDTNAGQLRRNYIWIFEGNLAKIIFDD